MRIYAAVAILLRVVGFIAGFWFIFHERHGYVGLEEWGQGNAAGSALMISGALAMLMGGYALAKSHGPTR